VAGLVVGALLLGAYFTFLEYVRPNEFGVKEVQIGVNRGIQEEVYGPGLWFVMPFGFQKMHRLPRSIQVLELSMFGGQETASLRYDEAAKINTSDGFYVDVDVTILYRIVDAYKVVTELGTGDRYLEQGVRPKADPILKQTLGQLTVEEFYNSPLRAEKAALARANMNAELADKGIAVEQVLVRYFKYSDAIQQNIEDKKLQDQLVFTNQSKRKAAQEEQQLQRVRAEGDFEVRVTLQEGDAYRVRREAERDLYVRSKEAEADLLVELAEAKRTELRNEAMQTAGSEAMVAMRMAEVLSGLDTVLLPAGGPGGLNPLALDEMLRLLGVPAEAPAGRPRAAAPAAVEAAGTLGEGQ
jgi:regulator of protease activity HflC (stomatin/prohibitin superfamily)